MRNFLYALILPTLIIACSAPQNEQAEEVETNPAAEGFNMAASDPQAVDIADQVMLAMGGRKNWDETRYLYWDFFGFRTLLWDKHTGDVRIEYKTEDKKIIVNEKTGEGQVWKNGELLDHPDSLSKYLDQGKRVWINDSYWLVMPFKLKDSGVTLAHMGEGSTEEGEEASVLKLTFESVGVTPNNAYEVWVSKQDSLVKQWAWYVNESDTVARFTLPWSNYQQMGGILLSNQRGNRDLRDVQVLETVPEGIFDSFDVTL